MMAHMEDRRNGSHRDPLGEVPHSCGTPCGVGPLGSNQPSDNGGGRGPPNGHRCGPP